MTQKVLSYDLGGTKVAVGVVNQRGKILHETRVPVVMEKGKKAVIQQLADLGEFWLRKYPEIRRVGIASAGPLDPRSGVLLNPINFVSSKGRWGKVPLARILQSKLKLPVTLENDAAAAILAEHWIGAAKNYQNCMILTLGTGLGTGVICNGHLVRSGRHLHPEGGHIIIKYKDKTARCHCGNNGCAEGFLSGRSFALRANRVWGLPKIGGREIADLARKKNRKALSAFREYSELLAVALTNYVLLYNPEIVIFTGSFAEAADLFLEETQYNLAAMSRFVPKLQVSTLHNEAGLIGGARVAFQNLKA